MSKSHPSSVTAEEAVARMVNMDYIPEGFTLEDILSAFKEEAEVEHHNAKIDHLPGAQIEFLRIRLEACEARRSLAQLLLKDLQNEVRNPQGSTIVLSQDSTSKPRYTLESVSDWAAYKYGIGIPEWSSDPVDPSTRGHAQIGAKWEDIEIRIRKDNIIAYSHKSGKWQKRTFADIGLLDRKTQEPNRHARILIGLSTGKKFPPSRTAEPKDKTAIYKLCKSLKTLTGIKDKPFVGYNKTDGWKPRFKLTYDTRNADDRAKKAARHEEFDDGRNYYKEDDETDKWIEDNQ